jgi:ribosomal peptide maturation radical SAM protein 1
MDGRMPKNNHVLLISMPFAGTHIPSIQLAALESYLSKRSISVTSKHLYLKAAEMYGINAYNYVIYPPNDSYVAQLFFTNNLFPQHWKDNYQRIKQYFTTKMFTKPMEEANYTFEYYVSITNHFIQWIFESMDFTPYDIIGFTLNYGQFLPSLSVARMIKEMYPEKKIVLGGSRTVGELGVRVLQTFDFIDFIVSGEGEEALYQLATNEEDYSSISGLIYRKEKIIKNPSDAKIDLNQLPYPTFESFFEDIAACSQEILQYYMYYGCLPIEISRGCWWNKCSFCNLNIQFQQYREKGTKRIIDEINFLSEKYKSLNFQIIGNTLPIRNKKELLISLKEMEKDFNFIAEIRADQYLSEDYTLLKDAGFRVLQTGIESFSQNYLEKMRKGTNVIDNIASLKYCKENNIKNPYNLIVHYPNEDHSDFEQTQQNITHIMNYINPPTCCDFKLMYGSPVYCNKQMYNIKDATNTPIDQLMFPENILKQDFSFVFDFTTLQEPIHNNWQDLLDNWKKSYNTLLTFGYQTQRDIDLFIFFFVDGKNYLKIYDKRNSNQIQIYTLNEVEREVFLSCIDIISFEQLKQKNPFIQETELEMMLQNFKEMGIVFEQKNHFLSLPLDLRKCVGIHKEKITPAAVENSIPLFS